MGQVRARSRGASHFGLTTVFTSCRAVLKKIDLIALATERRDLTAWRDGRHSDWAVLRECSEDSADRVHPLDWMSLDTRERREMTWEDWRQQFIDRFDEITFARQLLAEGAGV